MWIFSLSLSADEDGLAKITRVLAASPVKIDTLHIFSHAEPGTLLLGSKRIDSATLEQPYVYSQLHGTWRAALAEQADILFYGCELAAGEEGSGFIHRFSRISGADVGASDDLTGNAGLGGDWELEATVGHVEVAALHALSYPYTLGTTEISGRIKKDVQGDADIDDANDLGIPGVHVYLYRDINGNNLPDNSDVHYATAVTDANGDYAFSDNILTYTRATLPNGTYWLVAEVAGIDTLGATLEQTYGGTGAMIDPDSDSSTEGTYRSSAGSAFGGRRMDTYDSFSSTNLDLNTAEHIIRIDVNNGTNVENDFGFGFIDSLMGGYSEFYVPGGTDLIHEALDTLNDSIDDTTMRVVISVITSTPGTTIFYDHWEDGYDFNPDDPYNTSDEYQVVSNGGSPVIFEGENVPLKPRGATVKYDFGDRIYITGGPATVNVNFWEEQTKTIYANSWELFPVKPFQTEYTIPGTLLRENDGNPRMIDVNGDGLDDVTAYATGVDVDGDGNVDIPVTDYDDFEHVFGFIQATEDGTAVTATDSLGNLMELVTFDSVTGEPVSAGTNPVLNRGETVLIGQVFDGVTAIGTDNGSLFAEIKGSKPIQVVTVIGNDDSNYESRGITITPSVLWDNEYYMPVGYDSSGSGAQATVYFNNQNPFDITINYESKTDSGSFVVPANSIRNFEHLKDGIANNTPYLTDSAYRFISAGGVKYGMFAAIDTESQVRDWGMNLVPGYILRNEYFLGWAPGSNDGDENGSPVWVTPKYDNTLIYYDADGDGVADNPSGTVLNRYDSYKIFGPDNDQTGMHVWGTGPLAIAYGEDPEIAARGNPYLDLGYGVLPLPMDWMDVALGVIKTTDTPTVVPGGVADFSLVIPAWQAVSELTINDLLPAGWSYVAESTQVVFNNGGVEASWTFGDTSAVEPAQTTILGRTQLTWDVQAVPFNIRDLDPNDHVSIKFQAQAPVSGAVGLAENESTVCGKRDLDDDGSHDTTFCSEDSTFVSLTSVSLDKDTTSPRVDAGGNATFTIAIKNDGVSPITGVTIGDILPVGFTYTSGNFSMDSGPDSGCGGTPVEGGTAQEPEWSGIEVAGGKTCTITYTVAVASDVPAGIYDSDAWFTATAINQIFDYGETGQDPGTIITGDVNQDPEKDEDVEVIARDLVPDKAIIATSDNGSNGYAVSIGEIVRYRLQVQLPEANVAGLYLHDNIQQGMMLIEDSVRLSIIDNDNDLSAVTDNTILFGGSSDDSASLFSAKSTGTAPYRAVTHLLPDDNLSTALDSDNDDYLVNADSPVGTDVYFKIGDITNSAHTIDNAEYVVIEYNALVLNISANQSGTGLDNFFTAHSVSSIKISNEVGVTVTEPMVNISKNGSIRYTSGGGQAVYTITVSNPGTVGAYDLHITDQLDTLVGTAGKLDIDAFSDIVLSSSSGTVTGVDVTASDLTTETVDIVIGELSAGATAVFTVTADLVGVGMGDSIDINSADLTYTSLSGDKGSAAIDNPTESQTPGAPGSETGERNGSDGSGGTLNNFVDSGDAPLMTYSPPELSVDKSSSAGGTVNPVDTITYRVDIENTGGSPLNNVVVTDAVPAGTTFVSGTVSGYKLNQGEYRDDFSSAAYNLSTGSQDWTAASWDESGDDDLAGSGSISITNGALQFDTASGDSIERTIGNLSGKAGCSWKLIIVRWLVVLAATILMLPIHSVLISGMVRLGNRFIALVMISTIPPR
ncbi:hypothetical protein H206_01535 [Candidatus Electrothrix aarhusensis]|uniref:Uncharacterized protein n=1 Tax=Candidatus Electrothrix aarhusensis TaxID=1859131 RepID=A0A444J372_9BACT|nr:hypothetical protein H206_01535 [Candidatus Electrothrix aarhusensis]